jgi:hypothetical protein
VPQTVVVKSLDSGVSLSLSLSLQPAKEITPAPNIAPKNAYFVMAGS